MKLKSILLVAAVLVYSCTENSPTTQLEKTDTLLQHSDSAIANSKCSAALLDSVTNETTEKVTSNVEKLTELVKVYQVQSKNTKAVKEVIIRDTVYVETKKNFWGREKKKVTTSSDSSISETESVDTTIN